MVPIIDAIYLRSELVCFLQDGPDSFLLLFLCLCVRTQVDVSKRFGRRQHFRIQVKNESEKQGGADVTPKSTNRLDVRCWHEVHDVTFLGAGKSAMSHDDVCVIHVAHAQERSARQSSFGPSSSSDQIGISIISNQ